MGYDYDAPKSESASYAGDMRPVDGLSMNPKRQLNTMTALDRMSDALETQKDLINSLADVTRPYRYEEPAPSMNDSGAIADREPTSDLIHSILNRLDTVLECNARLRNLIETMR